MENQEQDFAQLKQLLALKKYEQPPPRYFNELPGDVISRLRAGRNARMSSAERLSQEAPWVVQFWEAITGKPAFAWGFGAAVSALILGGIFLTEKPASKPEFGVQAPADNKVTTPALFQGPSVATEEVGGLGQPVIVNSNSGALTTPTLFDKAPVYQTAPASFRP
jgi:hypothetical protein